MKRMRQARKVRLSVYENTSFVQKRLYVHRRRCATMAGMKNSRLPWAWVLAFVLVFTACSSTTAGPGPGEDGGAALTDGGTATDGGAGDGGTTLTDGGTTLTDGGIIVVVSD